MDPRSQETLAQILSREYQNPQINECNTHVSVFYVLWWGLPEGIRELVQNMIDEIHGWIKTAGLDRHVHLLIALEPTGARDGTDIRFFTNHDGYHELGRIVYNEERQTLLLQNPGCIPNSALLLGGGTKTTAVPSSDIAGRFGEGLKLAILCLLRVGKRVTIRTGGQRWDYRLRTCRPQFVEPTLHYAISKDAEQASDTVQVEVGGITKAEWLGTPENNQGLHCFLALRKLLGEQIDEVRPTTWPNQPNTLGVVLLGPHVRGKIFCKGIFVNQPEPAELRLTCGYDFQELELGRDRNVAVNQLQLNWMTSHTIAHLLDNQEVLRQHWPGLDAQWEWFLNATLSQLLICHGEIYYMHHTSTMFGLPGTAVSAAGANLLLHRWWAREGFRPRLDFPWHHTAQLTVEITELGLSTGIYFHKPVRCHPAAVLQRASDFRKPAAFVAELVRNVVELSPSQQDTVSRVRQRLVGLIDTGLQFVFLQTSYQQSYKLQNQLFLSIDLLNPELVAQNDPGLLPGNEGTVRCEQKLLIVTAKLCRVPVEAYLTRANQQL